MKILVACEESQVVTCAFRAFGHEAYSCDVVMESGGFPEWHLLGDCRLYLEQSWDMVIAFPPCTHLAVSGARWFPEKVRDGSQAAAIEFFRLFTRLDHVPRVAIENPIGIMSSLYRKPDQVIQPWWFGHGETKGTCLWLKGLNRLVPEKLVSGRAARVHLMPPSLDRAALRSKTYSGVARAMARQWGDGFEADLFNWSSVAD